MHAILHVEKITRTSVFGMLELSVFKPPRL